MNREEVFDIWAPPGATWSDWVKPVLFAHVNPHAAVPAVAVPTSPDHLAWLPPADGQSAIVIDLPATEGLSAAAAMARRGYRPVVLYNALPCAPGKQRGASVCDLTPHLDGIVNISILLRSLSLPLDAPPAFVLDSLRRVAKNAPLPGRFDNRSVSLATDFPSANRLLHLGIRRVVLLQTRAGQPQADLAHTLFRWQRAGIAIEVVTPNPGARPRAIDVARPSLLGMFFQRVVATLGLRRSPLGGFGGLLPEPSGSSG